MVNLSNLNLNDTCIASELTVTPSSVIYRRRSTFIAAEVTCILSQLDVLNTLDPLSYSWTVAMDRGCQHNKKTGLGGCPPTHILVWVLNNRFNLNLFRLHSQHYSRYTMVSRSNPTLYCNNVTDLQHSLSAELSQRLKDLLDQALLGFIRTNSMSQFAQRASELANFREAIAQRNLNDDIEFLRSFREFVPTTNYEPYRPFIAKFFATSCKESDVKGMFAPGLPYCLAISSTTSGRAPKTLPIYRPASHLLHHPLYLSLRHSEGSTLSPSSLSFGQALKMDLEDSQSSKMLPVCSVTVGFLRMQTNWDIEHDMDRLELWGKSVVLFSFASTDI